MLVAASIEDVEGLKEMGAARAYLAVKNSGQSASLNLLWALEGALQDVHWQEVAQSQRLSLLVLLEELEREG